MAHIAKQLGSTIVLFVFVFLFAVVNATAQDAEVEVTPSITPSPTPIYELPYPGLLPESPLYPLKMIRDRIVGFLIADPIRKAEFSILQADKRLNTAIYLLSKSKGKEQLAASTISKSENYLEEAIAQIEEAGRQGKDISEIKKQLSLSLGVHEKELKKIEGKIAKDYRDDIRQLQKRLEDIEKRANSLGNV